MRRYLGFACAALHWPPHVFWASTPHEFYAAIDSFAELNAPDARRHKEFQEFKESMNKAGIA